MVPAPGIAPSRQFEVGVADPLVKGSFLFRE